MKNLGWILVFIAFAVLGGFAYTAVEEMLLGKNNSLLQTVTVDDPRGAITFEIDFTQISNSELPAQVKLKTGLWVTAEGHGSVHLEPDSVVRVQSLQNGNLTVAQPTASLTGTIPATSTDLAERVANQRAQTHYLQNTAETAPPKTPPSAPEPIAPMPENTAPKPAAMTAGNDQPIPQPKPTNEPTPTPKPTPAQFASQAEALHPMPKFQSLIELVDGWKNVPKNAYPKQITIHVPLGFDLTSDGKNIVQGRLPAGASVVPVELLGSALKISTTSGMPTETLIDVDDTDFKERITSRYKESVRKQTESVLANRTAERERLAASAVHEVMLQTYNEGDDPRFDAMRESLRQGDAGFYQLDAASEWRWAGKETVDGAECDVAFVMMASESAFGVTRRELKAVILDNVVSKWIDVASGQEL